MNEGGRSGETHHFSRTVLPGEQGGGWSPCINTHFFFFSRWLQVLFFFSWGGERCKVGGTSVEIPPRLETLNGDAGVESAGSARVALLVEKFLQSCRVFHLCFTGGGDTPRKVLARAPPAEHFLRCHLDPFSLFFFPPENNSVFMKAWNSISFLNNRWLAGCIDFCLELWSHLLK